MEPEGYLSQLSTRVNPAFAYAEISMEAAARALASKHGVFFGDSQTATTEISRDTALVDVYRLVLVAVGTTYARHAHCITVASGDTYHTLPCCCHPVSIT